MAPSGILIDTASNAFVVGVGFDDVQSFEETHNRVFVKGCPIGQPLELFYFKH